MPPFTTHQAPPTLTVFIRIEFFSGYSKINFETRINFILRMKEVLSSKKEKIKMITRI